MVPNCLHLDFGPSARSLSAAAPGEWQARVLRAT
jgi:hypothetical protein